MYQAFTICRNYLTEGLEGWNRFWFRSTDPATLGVIRILAGSMLFYTHLVWSFRLTDFFGANGLVSQEAVQQVRTSQYAWTVYHGIESPLVIWGIHSIALIILALFTVGFMTRITSFLTFFITVSYANRVPVALFGLDQINGMLALYLMLGPSGAVFSIDRWIVRSRAGGREQPIQWSIAANISIRLIQIHMCVIYFFAGCGKLFGETWWSGTALWLAFGNYEYQSLDMTWIASWPLWINFLTHLTVLWEVSYAALIWPRWTRPLMLLLAILLHLGIAVAMGMITFGLVMLIANFSFVPASVIRRVFTGQKIHGGRAGGPVNKSDQRHRKHRGSQPR